LFPAAGAERHKPRSKGALKIKLCRFAPRRRAREGPLSFHGRFYDLAIFCCKMAQFRASQRESEIADELGAATERKPGENGLKNSSLN
jgi:hypothetical protein